MGKDMLDVSANICIPVSVTAGRLMMLIMLRSEDFPHFER